MDNGLHVTKLQVVSEFSKIYDPLSLVSPVVFHGKWFLQKLWSMEFEWDDCLPPALCEEWEFWYSNHCIPHFVGSNVTDQIMT